MRKMLLLMVLVGVGYFIATSDWPSLLSPNQATQSEQALADAFARGQSGLQVEGQGEVVRVLSDDTDGSQHQRFIIQLNSGQTLLVAHNIDLAPHIIDLQKGDRIQFRGEYEWNSQGGVLHWTHADPAGRHTPGWIKHKGRTYQ